MIKVVLTLALLGVAAAELTCEECSMIGTDFSALETSPEGIQRQIAMLHQPVCHHAPDVHHCEEHFPEFWKAIAMRLFDGEHGWFSPKHFCKGVCEQKSFLGEFVCRDCMMALNDSFRAMGNKEIQEKVVLHFVESDFCANFGPEDHLEACINGLHFILPEAMNLLAGHEHMHTNDFCVAEGCV